VSSTRRRCGGGLRPEKRKHEKSLICLETTGPRAQTRVGRDVVELDQAMGGR
jgi:hypothetical protein